MENDYTPLEPSLERNLKGHKKAITSLHYSPNETQIATGSIDNTVLLWNLRGSLRSYRFQGHSEPIMDVAFCPTGKYMASASQDKTVRLWVPSVIGSTAVFKAHSQTVRSVQFSPDGSKILTASDDKILKLWNTQKHKFISSFVGHTNWVRCARMTSDGSVIVSCSDDKTIRIWNLERSVCIHSYRIQKGYGLNVNWNPSGCFTAVGTSEGKVKLYDIRTQTLVQYYDVHKDAVTKVSFHPSGKYLISSSKDHKMKILDLLEGRPLFTLGGHSGAINAASFSPSGDYIASAGEDKLVFIWKTNFTEMDGDLKENDPQNGRVPKTVSRTSTKKSQDVNVWYKCYHGSHYPATTFVHLDEIAETARTTNTSGTLQGHSTMSQSLYPSNLPQYKQVSTPIGDTETTFMDLPSFNDTSQIPRPPPTPQTYTIPSVINNNSEIKENHLFGMISLKEDDVCYTSGTIEWVGKKRNFPINSGFKILHRNKGLSIEPNAKKAKFDLSNGLKIKECDCADVLPTMSAIVDHLDALHEAVDIVGLRLDNLEDPEPE